MTIEVGWGGTDDSMPQPARGLNSRPIPSVGVEYLTRAGYPVRVLCIDRINDLAPEQCVIVMDLDDGYCMEMNMEGEAYDVDDEDEMSYQREMDYDLMEFMHQ
jgi:hypothetical protein